MRLSEHKTTHNNKSLNISKKDGEIAPTGAALIRYEDANFVNTEMPVWNYSILYDDDIQTFFAGTHYSLYEKLGSKQLDVLGSKGFYFAVWAPNATKVSVVGSFNGWQKDLHPLYPRLDKSGIWEGFIPDITIGTLYKYHITGYENRVTIKGDPFANYWEKRPATSSITWNFKYEWRDTAWMETRAKHNSLNAPWSVYEVHLASWMRPVRDNEESYNTYHQIAERLVPYVSEMGFTHVELMPVMEYP